MLGKKSKECKPIYYWREGEERGGGREVEGRRGRERRRGRGETFYHIVSQFFLCPMLSQLASTVPGERFEAVCADLQRVLQREKETQTTLSQQTTALQQLHTR